MSPSALRLIVLSLCFFCASSATVPEDVKHKNKTWALVCRGDELLIDSAPSSGSYIFVYTTFKSRDQALDSTALNKTHRILKFTLVPGFAVTLSREELKTILGSSCATDGLRYVECDSLNKDGDGASNHVDSLLQFQSLDVLLFALVIWTLWHIDAVVDVVV